MWKQLIRKHDYMETAYIKLAYIKITYMKMI